TALAQTVARTRPYSLSLTRRASDLERPRPGRPTSGPFASHSRSRSGGFSSDGWRSCRTELAAWILAEARTGAQKPPLRLLLCEADRKSTRLNSSHQINSYAVFCLKK